MKSIICGCVALGLLLGCGYPQFAEGQEGKFPPQQLTPAEVRQHEAAVLNALDLSRPELAQVAAAWKRKDAAKAARDLAAYFRNRTSVHWGSATDSTAAVTLTPHEKRVAR